MDFYSAYQHGFVRVADQLIQCFKGRVANGDGAPFPEGVLQVVDSQMRVDAQEAVDLPPAMCSNPDISGHTAPG